jgi:hypothetical protein
LSPIATGQEDHDMSSRKIALALAAALVSAPGMINAEEHLVSPETADSRLAFAASQRAMDQAVLDKALSGAAAARAASSVGVDLRSVRQAVPALSNGELRDLARRAEALRSDPAAGLDHDVEQLLVVFLIVAIVILVIKAVD